MSMMKRSNGEYVWVEKGKKRIHEFTVFRTKHIRKISRSSSKNLLDNLDYMPHTAVITAARTELVQRLEADQCEHCGSTRASTSVFRHWSFFGLKMPKPFFRCLVAPYF